MKSWNLNFLETAGPLQACNGTALPFYCSKKGCLFGLHYLYCIWFLPAFRKKRIWATSRCVGQSLAVVLTNTKHVLCVVFVSTLLLVVPEESTVSFCTVSEKSCSFSQLWLAQFPQNLLHNDTQSRPGYNDIGLCDISSITSHIPWYQLIRQCEP